MAENPVYTFNASFAEFLPEYRDVTNVWIGSGSGGEYDKYGMLYARYASDRVQEIGYVTLYTVATQQGYTGTDADWADAIISLAAMDKGAITSYSYQNSSDGTNPPSGDSGWTTNPNPVKGQYLWTRIKLKWKKREEEDVIYTVAYQGKDGDVASVNNKTGVVVLYSTDISVSDSDNRTIKGYVDESITGINGSTIHISSNNNTPIKSYIDDSISDINGTTVHISSSDSTSIKTYIDNMQPETATDADIEALFSQEGDE